MDNLYLNFIYFIWHYLVGGNQTPQSEKRRRTHENALDQKMYSFLVWHISPGHKGQLKSYRPYQTLMTP